MAAEAPKPVGRSHPPASPFGKSMDPEGSGRSVSGICIFLAAIVWSVFGQTLGHKFVNFDDGQYVYENPVVRRGLTLDGIVSVFAHISCANWHPVTLVSHMVDCQLYGLNPGGHHLTNLLLHAATAILLFLVLRRMTRFLWRSAFVAAVFAIHPLRVESVAWVAERKDVLSGLFFMATLWFYTRYAQGVTGDKNQAGGAALPRTTTVPPKSIAARVGLYKSSHYWLALSCFALGLLSKPMLVTLPVVLLLLDYWPLGRMMTAEGGNLSPAGTLTRSIGAKTASLVPLLWEKLPWFGLSLVSGGVTLFAQHEELLSPERFSFSLRVANALVSYVDYLSQMLWPAGLAVLYPFPAEGVGVFKAVSAAILLLAISSAAWILRRRHPYVLTGWLWYIVMLLPVIGVLQVGWQSRADRYMYLPQIGLCLGLTWAAATIVGTGWRYRRVILAGSGAAVLAGLLFCARRQAACWRDSETLWTHALACTSGNFIAHYNYGVTLFEKGEINAAIVQYRQALDINAKYEKPYYNLGNILIQRGEADAAIACFEKAVQTKPDFADALNNLGSALLQQGRLDEAIIQLQNALAVQSDDAQTLYRLGKALQCANRAAEAIVHYRKALQIEPDFPPVLNNLAWLLSASSDPHLRNGIQAVHYAGRACALTHYHDALPVSTLAAAYAEAGRFDDAIAAAQTACTLAEAAGDQALSRRTREFLRLYRARQSYHEPPAPGGGAQ